MPADLLLSIDQGTTNTKASLIERSSRVVFRSSRGVRLNLPKPGLVEQSPQHIWDGVCETLRDCARHAEAVGSRIAGIAISNQRETAVAWRCRKSGMAPEALSPAISWQCRRSTEVCAELARDHDKIRAIAGLPVDPLVSAGKWAWMLRQLPDVKRAALDGSLRLGNIDAWLLACLTRDERTLTDRSNASRTALLDLKTLSWSNTLLSIFDIPSAALPQICSSSHEFGRCVSLPELADVPIVAMIGDSHAAMAGHGSYSPGTTKATYGTGSSVMALTGTTPPAETSALARTVAWSVGAGAQFALEGNIPMTGSALQWVGEFLELKNPVEEAAVLSESVEDAGGLVFVPAMVGMGAPYWDTEARGTITGLERSHTRAHLAHAAIEAIAHQIADVVSAVESAASLKLPALRADGGPTRNDRLMQLQADVLGCDVLRASNEELSTLGAAALGGLTLGWWNSLEDFASRLPAPTTFRPSLPESGRAALRDTWAKAIARTRIDSARPSA